MKSLSEKTGTVKSYSTSLLSNSPKVKPNNSKPKSSSSPSSSSSSSLFPGIFVSALSIFEGRGGEEPLHLHVKSGEKEIGSRCNGWVAAVRRVMSSGSMRRIKEQMLGFNKSNVITSNGDIWLLGVCYKRNDDSTSVDPVSSNGFAAFVEDFSSRILMTYRKGFVPIGDSNYTSDVNWGCMIRSSQMLIAQALLVHRFGRSWRLSATQLDQGYIEILYEFGDSEESAFSIHKLMEAGRGYGLAVGSWVGPYAMCRAWETLARGEKEATKSLPMAVHIVSGDENGERGGAPVVCVEDVSSRCVEYSGGQAEWTAVLLLVPLVLGLDKVNPRYVPLLRSTFTFPQSCGILGGKPGVSTYIVGAQDEKAFYLDPHEVQPVVNVKKDDLEADTSSYHCNVVRNMPLESIDPSMAIGFYCRDKDDFDDFCTRASKLTEESNGAPLFTVTQNRTYDDIRSYGDEARVDDSYDMLHASNADEEGVHEDDWQLL